MSKRIDTLLDKELSAKDFEPFLGKLCLCRKPRREFVAKLIEIRPPYLVFQTRSGSIIHDFMSDIRYITEV